MPYATANCISQSPLEGGIEISDAQYIEALAGIQEGKAVSIAGGFSVAFPVPPEPEEPAPLTNQQRIAVLQGKYDSDRDRLNKAWLSALIADGAGEDARKALIKSQMDDLDAQFEADMLAIIMGE